MASSSSSPSNRYVPPTMKNEETRNWADLPPELTSSILLRLSVVDKLENAKKVCRSWRRVCKDPSIWQKIDMRDPGDFDYKIKEAMCLRAVDLSQGGLIEINIGVFVTDDLLNYIAERSSNLRCLRVADCCQLSRVGILDAVSKLPLLEELKLSYSAEQQDFKGIGECCPNLKKLKLKYVGYMAPRFECDDDALAIAETMSGLRYLKLLGNKLSSTGLNSILDSCPYLEHLDLRRCPYVNLVGDLEKRCFERIKDVRRPNDHSNANYPFYQVVCDTESSEEEEEDSDGSVDSDELFVILGETLMITR